jgi:hypothetical protein
MLRLAAPFFALGWQESRQYRHGVSGFPFGAQVDVTSASNIMTQSRFGRRGVVGADARTNL